MFAARGDVLARWRHWQGIARPRSRRGCIWLLFTHAQKAEIDRLSRRLGEATHSGAHLGFHQRPRGDIEAARHGDKPVRQQRVRPVVGDAAMDVVQDCPSSGGEQAFAPGVCPPS